MLRIIIRQGIKDFQVIKPMVNQKVKAPATTQRMYLAQVSASTRSYTLKGVCGWTLTLP